MWLSVSVCDMSLGWGRGGGHRKNTVWPHQASAFPQSSGMSGAKALTIVGMWWKLDLTSGADGGNVCEGRRGGGREQERVRPK